MHGQELKHRVLKWQFALLWLRVAHRIGCQSWSKTCFNEDSWWNQQWLWDRFASRSFLAPHQHWKKNWLQYQINELDFILSKSKKQKAIPLAKESKDTITKQSHASPPTRQGIWIRGFPQSERTPMSKLSPYCVSKVPEMTLDGCS